MATDSLVAAIAELLRGSPSGGDWLVPQNVAPLGVSTAPLLPPTQYPAPSQQIPIEPYRIKVPQVG